MEIDTRKFFIDYCITVDEKFTGNGHHFKRGFTIHEKNKNVEQKFIYVETKFPVQNKITLRLCLAIVSGKNFYYCSQIDGDCPKKYFTIIFSHGLCIRCEIGIFPEGEIGDSILHNLPIRCSFLNVKEIVMNNLSGE